MALITVGPHAVPVAADETPPKEPAGISLALPVHGTSSGQRVPAALFGLHDSSHSAPHVDSIRLWDDGSRWDQVSTAPGVYDWSGLDMNVRSAITRRASEILYVLGSTPQWAARHTSDQFYYGAGTAAMPRDETTWQTWVHDVAARYKGQITAYEIWNEANMSAFFAGTPQEMARLTQIAAQEIRAVDPDAKIIAPSVVLREGRTGWLAEYLAALKETGTTLDAINVHGYVWLDHGPGNGTSDQRRQVIRSVQDVARQAGFDIPLWDTEVNFGNLRENGWPTYTYPEQASLTMLARSFVDSQRMGVTRQFWYAWDKQVMSVNLTDAAGSATVVGHAFYRIRNWMADAEWLGCRVRSGVRVCGLLRHGRISSLMMTARLNTGKRTVEFGTRARWVCHLNSSCQRRHATHVSDTPVLVRYGQPLSGQLETMARPKPSQRERHD